MLHDTPTMRLIEKGEPSHKTLVLFQQRQAFKGWPSGWLSPVCTAATVWREERPSTTTTDFEGLPLPLLQYVRVWCQHIRFVVVVCMYIYLYTFQRASKRQYSVGKLICKIFCFSIWPYTPIIFNFLLKKQTSSNLYFKQSYKR